MASWKSRLRRSKKKIYQTKSKELASDYDKRTTDIGKKVFGEFANDKLTDLQSSSLYKSYADFGKQEVDDIISFRTELFNDKK